MPALERRRVLAVCAHPDDESFGLGGAIDHAVSRGSSVSLLCFTHGEASTLGAEADLARIRQAELSAGAAALGIARVRLLDFRDGHLSDIPLAKLSAIVADEVAACAADVLLVFDEGGITGHPDHERATAAALAGAAHLPVLAWCIPRRAATALNTEFGTSFLGRTPTEVDCVIDVDRDAQRRACRRHTSQAADNAVLWRRLDVLGPHESLRWLRRPDEVQPPVPASGAARGSAR